MGNRGATGERWPDAIFPRFTRPKFMLVERICNRRLGPEEVPVLPERISVSVVEYDGTEFESEEILKAPENK